MAALGRRFIDIKESAPVMAGGFRADQPHCKRGRIDMLILIAPFLGNQFENILTRDTGEHTDGTKFLFGLKIEPV
jgi:hypothetical protein